MKKKIFLRSMSGFPLGVTIGYFITIVASLLSADGYYIPCPPQWIDMTGNEINAVLLQALLCGIVGSGFAASSVIWEIENWGLIKQTGLYFMIISIIMMPIAYVSYWMEHSVKGILSYFGIFVSIFIIIWITLYLIMKHNVKKMNENLHKRQRQENA